MLKEWDWENSAREFKIGIGLNPNYATGHHWYAEMLLFTGNSSEAFREISLAVDLDPVSLGILKDKGIFYYYNRQYDEAIDVAKKIIELDSTFASAHRLLSLAYQGKKMFDEAIAENECWGDATGNKVKTEIALAQIYAAAGRKDEALKIIEEVTGDKIFSGNDYRGVALIYVSLGDTDKAFEWLEKSYQMHEESLCSIKVDPKVDILRTDLRFNNLLKKVNLLTS